MTQLRAPFLPVRDAATQRALDHAHATWRRHKFGAAALGCALLLGGCGGSDEPSEPEQQQATPPIKVPNCPEREKCL